MTKRERERLNKNIHQLAYDLDSVQLMLEGKDLTEARERALLSALTDIKLAIQSIYRTIGRIPDTPSAQGSRMIRVRFKRSMDGDYEDYEFADQAALMSSKDVARWERPLMGVVERSYHTFFGVHGCYLMDVRDDGKRWWVVCRILEGADEIDLPKIKYENGTAVPQTTARV